MTMSIVDSILLPSGNIAYGTGNPVSPGVYPFRWEAQIALANFSTHSIESLATIPYPAYTMNTFMGVYTNNAYCLLGSTVPPGNYFQYAILFDFEPGPTYGLHTQRLEWDGPTFKAWDAGPVAVPLKSSNPGIAFSHIHAFAISRFIRGWSYDRATNSFSYGVILSEGKTPGGQTFTAYLDMIGQTHRPEYDNALDVLSTCRPASGGNLMQYGAGPIGPSGSAIVQFPYNFQPPDIQGIWGRAVYIPGEATFWLSDDSLSTTGELLCRWTDSGPNDYAYIGGSVIHAHRQHVNAIAISVPFKKIYLPNYGRNYFGVDRWDISVWPPVREETYDIGTVISGSEDNTIVYLDVVEPYIYVAVRSIFYSTDPHPGWYKIYDPALEVPPTQHLGGGDKDDPYIMTLVR